MPINNVIFMLAFGIGRLGMQIFFLYSIRSIIYDAIFVPGKRFDLQWEQYGFYASLTCQAVVIVLNIFWMRLILQGLVRLIRKILYGKNTSKGSSKATKEKAE